MLSMTLAGASALADTPALPESLKSGLALWLSAEKNVFEGTFNGKDGVIHWCDVREAFADGEAYADHASFSYPVASATTTTPYTNLKGGLVPPALVTDASSGLKYIDFGDYGNSGGANNWMFIENGSGALRTVTSRSLFAVVSFCTENNFGTVFGQIPALTSNSGATGSYFKRQPGAAGGNIANTSAIMQNGETRLNGKRTNPETTTYGFDGLQVFSQVGPGSLANGNAPVFNTFFNDRNQGTATQGGGRLHEVLVYDRVLTWEERAAVEQYLSEKWLGAAFEVEASGVTSPTEAVPAENATYDSAVAISLASLSNQTITANGATLNLRIPAAEGATDEIPSPFDDMATNYVSKGSFEEPVVTGTGNNAYQYTTPSEWSKSGSAILTKIGSAFYNPTSIANPAFPDGDQAVAIAHNSWISQQVSVPVNGLYKLSFYMTRRPGRSEGADNTRAKILVDDILSYYGCVSEDPRGEQNLFKRYVVELPPLSKGQHTLKLAIANNTSADRAVLFDKVELSPVAAGEFVYIPNAGFESAGPVTYTENVGYDAVANDFGTDIFAWSCPTFYVDGNSCHARLAQNSQYYYWKYTGNQAADLAYSGEPPDERDYRKLVLVRAGYAAQTIHVPRAGRLRFSMRYSRSYWGASAGQKTAVMLGESEVARTDEISSVNTQTFVQDFDWASAGDFTLMITNILGTSASIATVVDDLRLEYVDNVVFDCTRPEGSGAAPAALGDAESVSATLSVASNGFYYLAVSAAGLAIEDTSAAGVYNSYKYYPARAKVMVDGVEAARFVVETPDFTHSPVRLPYLTAGSHAISVVGMGDSVATLGKVRVQKAELLPLEIVDGETYDFRNAKFILNNGAKLHLDYLGTNKCRGVKIDGVSLKGIIGEEDCASIEGPGKLDIRPFGMIMTIR